MVDHSNQLLALPEGDRIVPMQAADLSSVHELESASQQEPWSLQYFVDELNNPVASVDLYWCGSELAGFLCTWLIAGELQIQNLATLPAMRRKGVAARLLAYVLDRSCKVGLNSIWLEVRTSNSSAIALYERFGFVVSGTRSGYYPDGEDALLMTCCLDMGEKD
jgi:ribosomal-protein-alanine N-acetyltransferase